MLRRRPGSDQTLAAGALLPTAPFPLEDTFFLHSVPGATKTIYLDFDGFLTRNTQWNIDFSLPNILTPAFDLDGDLLTFSDSERYSIQSIWERVAEDFRPFKVDVTTEDPGIEALRNFGASTIQLPPVTSLTSQVINDQATVFSLLNFSGPVTSITDINVSLNISHTFDSDLSAILISPQGTAIDLFANIGGDGNNFLNTIFDDQATTAITDPAATPPFAGSFMPVEALSCAQRRGSQWELDARGAGQSSGRRGRAQQLVVDDYGQRGGRQPMGTARRHRWQYE